MQVLKRIWNRLRKRKCCNITYSLLYDEHFSLKERMRRDVPSIEEIAKSMVSANVDMAALVDGLRNDAVKSCGTLQAMVCSLLLRLQKLIVHEISATSMVMKELAHDTLV